MTGDARLDAGCTPLVDVRDMLVVHDALRRELRLLDDAVRRTPSGDRRRAGVVADHLHFVLQMLHHHHEGEDALLWPRLLDRVALEDRAVMHEVEAQHAGLDAELSGVEALRGRWAGDPTAGTRDTLAAHLGHLRTLLEEHLRLEEDAVLPLAARLVSADEWNAVGESAVAATPKPLLPLTFGMLMYRADPDVVAGMLHAAPPPVRLLLPPLARRAYARRARTVHGTPTP